MRLQKTLSLILLTSLFLTACGVQRGMEFGESSSSSSSSKKKAKTSASYSSYPSSTNNSNTNNNANNQPDVLPTDPNCETNLTRMKAVAQYCGPAMKANSSELSRACSQASGAMYTTSCYGINDSIAMLKQGCTNDFKQFMSMLPSSCQSAISYFIR